jgi:hypothetical protein
VIRKRSIGELIARSSLGAPGAAQLRAAADPEAVDRILKRAAELDAQGAPIEGVDDDNELTPEFLSGLERELDELERKPMSDAAAEVWWRASRRAWGRLQQVKKGTRVRCPCCGGAHGGCPMCSCGFVDRDEAIAHYETEMEFACKCSAATSRTPSG